MTSRGTTQLAGPLFIWERLFESTNYIIAVVKLNNIHLFNIPQRQRTNTSGLVSSRKSQTATFSRDCMLHLSFVMEPQWMFLSRESTLSTITVSQRETQTGHQIGHCSMPRVRCQVLTLLCKARRTYSRLCLFTNQLNCREQIGSRQFSVHCAD